MQCSMICRRLVPGFSSLGCHPVQRGPPVIGEHQALVGVEHGQALVHVGQGRVEHEVLLLEPGIGLLELAQRAIERPQRQDREGEIGGDAEREA